MNLQVSCPHCGRTDEDAWEALCADCVETLRCDACHEHFYLGLMFCPSCAHETRFCWGNRPALCALTQLSCERCMRSYRADPEFGHELDAQALA
jgi:hypothetical protein